MPASNQGSKQLATFLNIKEHEKLAVVLRSEGKSYEEIVAAIKSEYNLDYQAVSLRVWFMAGGRLEQAYLDYIEELGNAAVKEGKLAIRRATRPASNTLISLLADQESSIKLRAALGILNKYVPDKQIMITEGGVGDDDLPEELSDTADDIVTGGTHGADKSGGTEQSGPEQPADGEASDAGSDKSGGAKKSPDGSEPNGSEPMDDAQQSKEAEKSAGDGSGESVPDKVLQERETPDTSSNPAS